MFIINGMAVTSASDQLEIFVEYVSHLYESLQPTVAECGCSLESINLPVLTKAQQLTLNADITIKETEAALQHMKLGKTPGLDGLPTELYRVFKDDLLLHLQELLNYCYQNTIPSSWKEQY